MIFFFNLIISTTISNSTVNFIRVNPVTTANINVNSGTTEFFYSQTFDSYGNPISGVSLYYNVTLLSENNKFVAGGYAGESSSGGFTVFNISDFFGGNYYQVNEHIFKKSIEYDQNVSFPIDTTGNTGYTSTRHASITPVYSTSDPGKYALHIWTPPGVSYSNSTLSYEKGTDFTDFITPSGFYNENLTVSQSAVNISGSHNYQTQFSINGLPYFYVAVLKESSGTVVANTIFSTTATPLIQSQMTFGGVISGTYPFLLLGSLFFILTLNSRDKDKRYPIERFFAKGTGIPDLGRNSSTFYSTIAVNAWLSIPFIAITLGITAFITRSAFGQTVSAADIFVYGASTILMVLLASSVIAMVYISKYRWLITGKSDGENLRRSVSRIMTYIASFAVFFYYFGSNFSGYFSISMPTRLLVNLDIVNPFTHIFLVLMMVDNTLFTGTIRAFDPSSYGLTWLLIIALGVFWLFLIVVLPYFLYRRSEGKLQDTGRKEDF